MILLVRHGETDWNREGRFQGQLESTLTDAGREQARGVAERVASEGIRRLVASPLGRARETAEIIGARVGLDLELDDRLKEIDVGTWGGRLREDVERDEPEAWAQYRSAGADFRFPGGESLQEQQDRTVAALVDATQAGVAPVLLVTHGGVIRCALAHTHKRGLDTYHEWRVPNAELVRL